jgi:hypothetical protein
MRSKIASGTQSTLRAAATLTSSYVASSSIDLEQFDSATIEVVSVGNQAKTLYLAYQWSHDDSVWFTEKALTAGTATGGVHPFVANDKQIQIDLTTAGNLWTDRAYKQARFFRVQCKEAAGTTTATVAVSATPRNLN